MRARFDAAIDAAVLLLHAPQEIDQPKRLVDQVRPSVVRFRNVEIPAGEGVGKQLGQIEHRQRHQRMVGPPVPIARIHVAAPGVGQRAIGQVVQPELEAVLGVGGGDKRFQLRSKVADRRVLARNARLGDIYRDPVFGMKRARPHEGRMRRAQRDAAALAKQAAHGLDKCLLPCFLADFEREGAADALDADPVHSGCSQRGEIQPVDIGLGFVGRVRGAPGQDRLPGENRFRRLRVHDMERKPLGIGQSAACPHPEGEKRQLRRIVRTKADLIDVHCLAEQPQWIEGKRKFVFGQQAVAETNRIAPAGFERMRQPQNNRMLHCGGFGRRAADAIHRLAFAIRRRGDG
ncbi:MAG: hypothetical protein BWZ10_02409 [candidate division BRC1 bacterium ADurb.BinA364]|nr:MAG: hypothetical protein BWZ10_02409 [candidate division BRC1 bacterium ADurb.BinA364]